MTDAHNDPGGVDDKPSEPTTFREVLAVALNGRGLVRVGRDLRPLADAIIASLPDEWNPDCLLKERDELRAALISVRIHIPTQHHTNPGVLRQALDYIAGDVERVLSKSEEQEGG